MYKERYNQAMERRAERKKEKAELKALEQLKKNKVETEKMSRRDKIRSQMVSDEIKITKSGLKKSTEKNSASEIEDSNILPTECLTPRKGDRFAYNTDVPKGDTPTSAFSPAAPNSSNPQMAYIQQMQAMMQLNMMDNMQSKMSSGQQEFLMKQSQLLMLMAQMNAGAEAQ